MVSGDGGVGMTDDGSDVLRDAVERTSLGKGDKEGTVRGEVGGGGDTT